MISKIILSAVALIMLFWTLKKGDKQTVIFTLGLTVGILLTWLKTPIIVTFGLLTYMFTAFMIAINSVKKKKLPLFNRITILLSGSLALIVNLLSFLNLPYLGSIRLILIIPVVLYIISLFLGMTKRKDCGYLSILNTELALRFIG